MNPEPRADALIVRTRWHIGRNLESGIQVPRAGVVGGEDNKIFRLDIVNI